MALLTKQQIGLPGASITFTAAAGGGDTVVVDTDDIFLLVKNASGAPITVTIADPRAPLGQAQPGVAFSVPATTGEAALLLPQAIANASGVVSITYSGVTSLTVAALRC